MHNRIVEHEAWPARAAILAGLGATLGLLFNLIIQESEHRWTEDPLRLSGASIVAVAGITLAFTLERVRWLWSVLFALACGIVVALVFFWNGSPSGWTAGATGGASLAAGARSWTRSSISPSASA